MPGAAPDARFGLDDAAAFRLVDGGDAAGAAGAQAAWYFAGRLVAVPVDGAAGFAHETRPMHDVRRWSDAHVRAPRERPPLVWLDDALRVRRARLAPDAASFTAAGHSGPLRFVAKLATNSAWFDQRSAAFFAARDVALRGCADDGTFVASALWPEDWTLGPQPPPAFALPAAARPGLALRALMRGTTAEATTFSAGTLWERTSGAPWSGCTALAFVVNGGQGDDDEAHAGHFSIATGRVADDGAIDAWLVDSLYSLDVVSEKGIVAAPVPLDRYQGDLNSGQAWYRPSWALVAILDDERAAVRVQSALGRVFRHFWRGELAYYHPTDNCTSIAMDTLRALGLDAPVAGPTARWTAWLALPWLVLKERSVAKAKLAFDYLVTERTRLLPAVALEAVFEALWSLAHGRGERQGRLGMELAVDLRALAWLSLPQYPSSRAWGDAPAVSLDEYRSRVPRDPAARRIIPLAPRALPEALRDDDILPRLPHPSELAVRWWAVAPLAAAVLALAFLR
ncbi:MAG TPA: hypothetical protein VFX05_18365 [Casimicrobiaceae bacterium]|nr:hypothetical protein [Casimicrobiaceae bacterium]